MKWYTYYTNSRKTADALSRELKIWGIVYNISGCGDGYEFQIYTNKETAKSINGLLDCLD